MDLYNATSQQFKEMHSLHSYCKESAYKMLLEIPDHFCNAISSNFDHACVHQPNDYSKTFESNSEIEKDGQP